MNQDRVPFLRKLGYGAGDTPLSLFFTTLSLYFLFFLTDIAGVPPAAAAAVYGIGRIWDAVSDPIMGYVSDGTRSPLGRRRPYILFGAPALAMAFILLFRAYPGVPIRIRPVLYCGLSILFFTAFTVVAVPYSALAPEMTPDYDERTRLVGFRMAFSILMSLAAGVVPGLFLEGPDKTAGFARMALVLGPLGILPSFFTVWAARERTIGGETPRGTVLEGFKAVASCRPFRYALAVYILSWVTMDIIGAVLIYYVRYVVHQEALLNYLFLAIFGTAALFLPVWSAVSARIEKATAYAAGGIVIIAAVAPMALLSAASPAGLLVGLAVLAGVGFSSAHIFPWAMVPECVDRDEADNGVRREGLFSGFLTFSQKAASSLSIAVVGVALSASGYVAGAEQGGTALWAIRLLTGAVPAVMILCSILVALRYPITRKEHRRIRAAIEARREGVGSSTE